MIKYAFLKELRSKFMTHLIILFLIYLSISFFDEKAILLAQNCPTFIKQFFSLIGSLGNSSYIFIITIGLMFYSKHLKKNANKKIKYFSFIISQQSFLLFSFTLISGIGVNILKCIIGRARPCCLDSYGTFYLNGLSIDYDFLSFPSGHTATIFTMAYIFGIYAPKYRYIIYILASLIGISRIVTIDHYPSDVIAGGYLGLVIGKFCAIFFANKKIALNFKRTILEVRGKRFLKNQF